MAGALLGVLGYVGHPERERGKLGLFRHQLEGLVRVPGLDRDDVGRLAAADALGREQVGAAVLLPADVAEQVPGLHGLGVAVVTEELGLDLAQDAPVQELVVHVQQVLVHERVVALDGARERHRLVLGRVELRQRGKDSRGRLLRVAGEHEHQAVGLAHRVGADAPRGPADALGQVRNLRDAAVPPVGPGVIAAAQQVALDDAHAQRHLAVGAPVLQRVDRAALTAVQRDPLAREQRRKSLLLPHARRYGHRIPEVRVDPGASQVGHRAGLPGIDLIRQLVRACRRPGRDCLSHALPPTNWDP